MSVKKLVEAESEIQEHVSSALANFMEWVNDGRCGYTDEAVGLEDLEDLAIKLFVRQNIGGVEPLAMLFLDSFAESHKDHELSKVLHDIARRTRLFFSAVELFEKDVQTLLGNLYKLDDRRREERQRYARENSYSNPQIVTTQYQDNVAARRAMYASQRAESAKQNGVGHQSINGQRDPVMAVERTQIPRPSWAEQVGEGEMRTCTATAKAKSTIWQIDNLPEAKVSHRLRNRLLEQLEYDTDVSRLLASVIRWIDCQKNSNSFQDFYWMSFETKSNDMVFSVRTDQKLVEIEKVPTSWGQQFDGRIEFYACNQETDGRRLWQLMLRGEN